MDNGKTLGQRLEGLRTQRRMTLRDVGKAIGMSHGSVRAIELGTNNPRPKTLTKLADLFGVSEAWLVFGSEASGASGEMVDNRLARVPIMSVNAIVMSASPGQIAGQADDRTMYVSVSRRVSGSSFALILDGEISAGSQDSHVRPGDLIVIDPEARPTPSCLIVARFGNDLILGRLREALATNGTQALVIVPVNPDRVERPVKPENIVGRVVELHRPVP